MLASLLETILITNLMCGSAHHSPVPSWIRVLVLHILGRLVLLPAKLKDEEDTVIRNPDAQGRVWENCLLSCACESKPAPTCSHVSSATEMKLSSLGPEHSGTSEQKGSLNEDEALEELRSLGSDLQAIRLQVEQQVSKSQSSDEWLQVGLVIDRLLFVLYIIFLSVSFITIIGFWVQSSSTP